MPFVMHQPIPPASTYQRTRIIKLAKAKLRFPEHVIAKVDLLSSADAKRMLAHLLSLPNWEDTDGPDAA